MATQRIVRRWNDAVLWEGEAETVREALHAALRSGADLTDADLRGANLRGADLRFVDLRDANLRGANLRGANLRGANLTGANLRSADLRGANLTDANLRGANLRGADLTGANLTGANLRSANLTGANLTPIRDDVWAVLSGAPAEVPALLAALKAGRVNGSTYEGPCACLVGTIANARHCDINALGDALKPNSARPAERFFLGINEGDTPESNPHAKLAAEWIEDWLARMRAAFSSESSHA